MGTVVVNGFFVGLIYALIGVGLVFVYRGSRVVNFAYGETGMIGAFLLSELWVDHRVTLLLALPIAIVASAAVGAGTEIAVVRPLRDQPRLTVMVGTLGVAALLQVFAVRRWGPSPRSLPPLVSGAGVRVLGFDVQPIQLVILAVSAALIGALWALYRYTAFGLRLRATAIDPYAAAMSGVNIDRTSVLTWALAGALSGLTAILIGPLVAFHVFFMTGLVLRGIAAALVGGMTSVSGAVIAGVAIGVAEGVIGYTTPVSGVVEAGLSVFMIGLLILRPTGLVRSSY